MKFFQLTRNERLGLVGIVIILLGITIYRYFDTRLEFTYIPVSIENNSFESSDSLNQIHDKIPDKFDLKKAKEKRLKIHPFEKFDPNKVDSAYWSSIGFDSKMSMRLARFYSRGKRIESVDDLSRVYGMKREWLIDLKEYIKVTPFQIDINTASLEEFEEINGIGSKLSHRIVKFREKLGGFSGVQQLYLVYGLDSNLIKNNIHTFKIEKPHYLLDVNTETLNNLSSHPFIGRIQAEEIIRLRSVNGLIDSTSLRNIFTSEEWQNVSDYLKWKN